MRYGIHSVLLLMVVVSCPSCAPDLDRVKEATDVRETAAIRAVAEQGNADAQVKLGDCYANGIGVPEDMELAVFWYRKAAEQGNALAQFRLGHFFASGYGLPKDLAQAIVWFRKAAEHGNVDAQITLGLIYTDCESVFFDCEGVPKDLAQAAEWFRMAADHGDSWAMHCLGVLYERGDGVPRDLVAAYQWYDLAAEHGSGADEQLREELAKQMTPEQLAEAQSQTSPNGSQKRVSLE